MLVNLTKYIPDSESMPRVFCEPHFFSDISENVTKVNTFLVYQEDVGEYRPTRCAIDELGMYLILGIGDGVSIDLTHAIEVKDKWLANLSDGMHLQLNKFKEFSFCIEYSQELSERASIYLIAQTAELAKSYVEMLRELINTNRLLNPSLELLIAREFYRLRGFSKCTGRTYIKHFYDSMKIGKLINVVNDTLLKANFINDQSPAIINWVKLTMDKFKKVFIYLLKSTLEVIECYIMKAEKKNVINYEEFLCFIELYQSENEIFQPEEDPYLIYQDLEDNKNIEKKQFTLKAFHKYVFSEHFSLLGTNYGSGFQDMTYPLSYYYMNSSHNSYLVGRQIMGISSTQMYRNILLSGCRSVEIDCFDGPDQKPVITHGKAMCTTISLYDTLVAIKETAFIVSDYPVVISIENHLSTTQQRVMADYLESIFKDELLSKPLEENPLKPGVLFPSPHKLRRKIIIKNKKLPEEIEKEALFKNSSQLEKNSSECSQSNHKTTQRVTVPVNASKFFDEIIQNEIKLNHVFYYRARDGSIHTKEQEKPVPSSVQDCKKIIPVVPNNKSDNSVQKFEKSKFYNAATYVMKNSEIGQNVASCEDLTSDKTKPQEVNLRRRNMAVKFNREEVTTRLRSKTLNMSDLSITSTIKNVKGMDLEEYKAKRNENEIKLPNTSKHKRESFIRKVDSWPETQKSDDVSNFFHENQKVNRSLNNSNESNESLAYRGDNDQYQSSMDQVLIDPYLSSLVNYFKACSGSEFQKFDSLYFLKISSFNELVMEKHLRDNTLKIISQLVNTCLRVYPKPSRVDSSNFNPKIFWDCGVQLVALNFQTPDIGIQLNYAMFEINHRCGYVLKPDYLLKDSQYNPFETRMENYTSKITYTVKILSATFVTDPSKPDIVCQIDTYGSFIENISKKIKSTNNPDGLIPTIQFENEKITFTAILLKKYNFVRFAICDKNTTYGQRIISINYMKRGFRFIPLRNARSQQLPLGALYVFIDANRQK